MVAPLFPNEVKQTTPVKDDPFAGFTQIGGTVDSTNTAIATINVVKPVIVTDEDISSLGANAMGNVSSISQGIIAGVKASDVDTLGTKLNELVTTTKGLDPNKMGKPGFLGRILGFGSNVKEKLMSEYQTVEQRMDALSTELKSMSKLMHQRVGELDKMYEENASRYEELKVAIERGDDLIARMREYDASRPAPVDALEAQRVSDYRASIDRLDRRVDNLRRGQQLFIMSLPEIRMEQDNKRSLVESVANIETTLIPAWKGLFSRYIISMESKKGAAIVSSVYDATDEAFRQQADLNRQNAVDIAKQQQRSMVSTETLVHCQSQLLSAAEETQRIVNEGRAARAAARPQIEQLERDLIARFSAPNSTQLTSKVN